MSSRIIPADAAATLRPASWNPDGLLSGPNIGSALLTAPAVQPFVIEAPAQPAPAVPSARPAESAPPPMAPGPDPEGIRQEEAARWQARLQPLETRVRELERQLAEAVEHARQQHQAGLREGEAAARTSLEKQVHDAIDDLARSTALIRTQRQELLREGEADLVKLAIAIARRILHRELTVDPEAMTALIKVGLEKLRLQQIDRLRVSPVHASAIRRFLNSAPGGPEIALIEDASLSPGGAVFETSRGNLDVGLETQLDEVQRGLTDRLRS